LYCTVFHAKEKLVGTLFDGGKVMPQANKVIPFLILFILFLGFQGLFVMADQCKTAEATAVAFSKAYYGLDEDINKLVCENNQTDEEGASTVDSFFHAVNAEAQALGHNFNYMRSQLMKYHVTAHEVSPTEVDVHIEGIRKRCIHPVFTYIGKLFSLGDEYEFEQTLKVVKEEKGWRVCGDHFSQAAAKEIYGSNPI
jgi:hypothetical protein